MGSMFSSFIMHGNSGGEIVKEPENNEDDVDEGDVDLCDRGGFEDLMDGLGRNRGNC